MPYFRCFSHFSGLLSNPDQQRRRINPGKPTPNTVQRALRGISLIGLCATLGACASYRDVPPNSPRDVVLATMGTPNFTCPTPDGGTRAIWTQQPNGQYAYGTRFNSAGIADRMQSILTDENFRKLDSGVWTPQDVTCEYGPPAKVTRVGLGEKNEVVWEYRYKQANAWNSLMYVYLGRDGQQVTHHHPGPDPAYDHEFEFMGF